MLIDPSTTGPAATRVDVHQHVWTEPLLDALERRRALPFIDRDSGLTVLHSAGERPYVIDVAAESPLERERLLTADGVDHAIVALSSPIGIETLPRASAEELIDAHLNGVAALGKRFPAWGPLPVREPDPDDVDVLLARGCVGISLPAGSLGGVGALEMIAPVLDRVASRGVPLFVHPGPLRDSEGWEASLSEPLWWRALTDYVSQMQAAWLTFAALGRREHPDLVIVFAMLAGGAPIHSERLETRGGPGVDLRDPRTFYDTSSYGPAAIDAIAERVGTCQLLYGSDRPVLEPLRTERDAILQSNAARVFAERRSAVTS
jgi:predicted TIM-barrel fold metal-dependent hydrolase